MSAAADRTLVKLCGFTDPDQAAHAAESGADFVGVVLWEGSTRAVRDRGLAAAICAATWESRARPVGVFVDASVDQVLDLASYLDLAAVQLHGGESEDAVQRLSGHGLQVWKALQVAPELRTEDLGNEHRAAGAQALLIDGWHPTLPGGTGVRADWTLAAELAQRGPLVLAGGLSADNIAQAIETVRPWAVDASSSLERAPGDKDPQRVEAFLSAAGAWAREAS
ncbi:MAG: N-(5'-phosphoribosyl)anthranilate isomerase [Deltaproteobacteria bacterium]|nr:N-(5'-phosphoribosyl)anthranilate isomerase [Deltaproteobacteria bacterium]